MKEITTLDKIEVKKEWTKEDALRRNTLLLLFSQLCTLQSNLALEIEQVFKEYGAYNFTIKHNHREIQKLLKQNVSNNFFKRLNRKQEDIYSEDAEKLERLVYAWAGIEHPTEDCIDVPCVNLNLMATQVYDCAKKRGKINNYTSDIMQLDAIKAELNELRSASTNPSIHLEGYTEQEEEAADVIISTLTFLSMKGVSNINKLLMKKMKYNQNRED